MTATSDVSSLTLNRLSVYLRCLGHLRELGVRRISSKDLAARYDLSASLIRKDLAQFGEFGIRGVGYEVDKLWARLNTLLGLDREHRLLVIGTGALGSALARHLGFNTGAFQVVAGLDTDPEKIGQRIGQLTVRPMSELAEVIGETRATIAIMTVPAKAAQSTYDLLVDAGIQAVLNFAPVRLRPRDEVPAKSVDFRIGLEELAFLLRR